MTSFNCDILAMACRAQNLRLMECSAIALFVLIAATFSIFVQPAFAANAIAQRTASALDTDPTGAKQIANMRSASKVDSIIGTVTENLEKANSPQKKP